MRNPTTEESNQAIAFVGQLQGSTSDIMANNLKRQQENLVAIQKKVDVSQLRKRIDENATATMSNDDDMLATVGQVSSDDIAKWSSKMDLAGSGDLKFELPIDGMVPRSSAKMDPFQFAAYEAMERSARLVSQCQSDHDGYKWPAGTSIDVKLAWLDEVGVIDISTAPRLKCLYLTTIREIIADPTNFVAGLMKVNTVASALPSSRDNIEMSLSVINQNPCLDGTPMVTGAAEESKELEGMLIDSRSFFLQLKSIADAKKAGTPMPRFVERQTEVGGVAAFSETLNEVGYTLQNYDFFTDTV